jgi:hypothetical protein
VIVLATTVRQATSTLFQKFARTSGRFSSTHW